jgi:hypothetical protein
MLFLAGLANSIGWFYEIGEESCRKIQNYNGLWVCRHEETTAFSPQYHKAKERHVMPCRESHTIRPCWTLGPLRSLQTAIFHIPSDLVVDRGTSSVRGSLILGFPCTPYPRPRNSSENNISNINMLKIYH